MSDRVDPKILAKLRAFAGRRRKLILIRGICTAVAVLLATMMLVALVDWLFILPDTARWGLSAAAYLAVIIAEWRTCLRLLARTPGPRRLARLLEHAEPKLREDLLSAVELGTDNEGAVFDSVRFRELVQSDVASRMEDLDVERLLPVNLVKRYLGVAFAIVAALLVAFAITGTEFATLLMRALLPTANLGRVSKYKVTIIEPRNPEQTVPHGETVPLVIQVAGGHTNKAILETFSEGGGREVIQMAPLSDGRFSATIQVARQDVQYRLRAGDAITRKYKLNAAARPHVAVFHKAYTYPGYARMAVKKVMEDSGDLTALEGTEVSLGFETNQPIESGELRVDQGRKSFTIPLVETSSKSGSGSMLLKAKLPMDVSGTYRVHLVAAATGFENKFSPEYEIRVEPDLVPRVELESPKQDLILPANEIVDIQGTASDDQSLATVSQLVRVNEGEWQEVVLARDAGPKITVERRWDLYAHAVKPGDLLTFKLQAVDLKGNKAESRPLQVAITQAGFESKRLQVLESQRRVYQALKEMRTAAETLEREAQEASSQLERLTPDDPQRKQVIVRATAAQAEFERLAGDAWGEVQAALRETEAGHVGADLVLLGRLLCRIDKGSAQSGREAIDLLSSEPAPPLFLDQAREFGGASARTAQRVRLAEDAYRAFLAAEEVDVLNENLNIVAGEQERLATLATNSGNNVDKWAPLLKRIRVVIAETRSIEEMLETSAEHISGGYADRFRRVGKQINQARSVIDQAVKNVEPGKPGAQPFTPLAKLFAQLSRDLLAAKRDLLAVRRETAPSSVQTVAQLTVEIQPTYANFDKLCQDLRPIDADETLSAEARAHRKDQHWEARIAHFKLHGDLEEARIASDTYFVGDLRSTTLALQAMREAGRESKPEDIEEKLRQLDKTFRVLESGHSFAEILDGVNRLAGAERWEIISPRARTSDPRDWAWVEGRMKGVADELGKTELDEPVRKLIRAAQTLVRETLADPAARRARQEMQDRFDPNRVPVAVPQEIERVAMILKQALDLLRQPIDDAREQLAAMTPKLDEMMSQLAQESQELKGETSAQAEKKEEQQPGEAQAATGKTLAKQEALNEKIGTLEDALRSEANKQDILQDEGRAKARDIDDALALLKEPPQRAQQALEEAAQTAEPDSRQGLLQSAAEQQQQLADSLRQLAQHFADARQNEAERSRTALRATEEQTGVKEQLDAQYAKAEQMAELAHASPQDLLAELEKALPQNPVMQKALDSISANILAGAERKLAKASQQENRVAQQIDQMAAQQKTQMAASQTVPPGAPQDAKAGAQPPASPSQLPASQSTPNAGPKAPSGVPGSQPPPASSVPASPQDNPNPQLNAPQSGTTPGSELTQAAGQQAPIAQGANDAGQDVTRAGRHEARLQNAAVGQQLQQLGDAIRETAMTEVPEAQKALANARSAGQALPQVNAAKTELAQKLDQLRATTNPSPGSTVPAPGGELRQRAQSQRPPPSSAQSARQSPTDQSPGAAPASAPDNGDAHSAPPALGPASPREQVWMARTLDALDAALHASATPPGAAQAAAQQASSNTPSEGAPQAEDPAGMAQANSAMAATAQAAAAALRDSRGQGDASTRGNVSRSEAQRKSKGGAQVGGRPTAYVQPPEAKNLKNGEWGKLPKKVAEELSQGQRESVAGEYRSQVETYYRVIAEKARKP